MANSRHNKYVSVTDWFSTPTSASGATDAATGTGVATSGASFAGGSWGSGGGGGGSNITIIKTNDTTPESNSNVYSALRVHNNFIAKDKDERTTGKLASDVGFEVGEFVSGSSGALLYIDPDNYQTTAELDRLYVRVKAYFETLEIVNVNSVGGKQLISPAGSVRCYGVETTGTREIITEVQSTDEDGNLLYDENGNPIMETVVEYVDNGVPEGVYRCYFLAEQDGQKVENRFHVNDQAYSQTFNVSEGTSSQVGNRYYWRLVTGVSTDMVEFDGKQCHYIDLSILDCDVDSDAPQAEDIICHRGSRTESDRQNVLEFSAVDNFSPSITLYQGIGINDPDNDLYPYSLVGKDVVSYGVNQSTNLAFMNVYGNMYIGDRNGDQFLRFDDVSGLTIKANLDIGTKFGGDDLTLEERIELAAKAYEEDVNAFKDAVEKDLESIQNQIDGAIETYFYDPEPTLNNPPASNWDDTDKANHVGDLYYSGKGKAYRFQYDETNGYYWNIITDTDITLALANAKKAQDTADSKRKIFTERPATNDTYDIGDMWVNANYIDATHSYSNDLLRAVTAKAAGTVFSIDHWTLASKYTDDTFAQAAKAAADAAQLAADNALADASAANQRLNSWAADGSISPTEKQGIKEEWARVIADRDHIVSEYEKYELGTPTDYNNAYTPYIENLIALFQPTPENITIPSDFDDNQTAYYEQRTIALGVISLAAKKLADDAQTAADNALKEAEAALNAAEEAKQSVYDLNQDVTEFKNYTDGAFADNILSSSERSTIRDYVYQINTTKALVDESYNEVINNTFLVGSTEETNLKNGYNTFNTATNKLLSFISSITDGYRDENGNVIIENLDRAQFESDYNQFNSTYSDYTKYLHAATKFIEYAINSRVDTTLEALGGYSYLKNALNASTTITGGLVLTTMIALGYYDDNQEYNVMAGINGSCKTDDDITIWAGGSNVDKMLYPNDPQAADFLVRADGTGYAAGGNFWWESDGTIHADPLSFVISENSVGALLASFQVDYTTENSKPTPYAIKPLVPLYDVTFAGDIKLQDEARLGIGDIYLSYDKTNNAMCFTHVDGTPVNFYTTGGISMYGQGDTTVTSIADVIEQMLDPNTLEINDEGLLTVIGGTSGGGGGTADAVAWENITGKPSFATVATSGSYNDLLNKPTLLSSFTNDVGYLTEHQDLSGYQTKITSTNKLAYSLISGTPTIPTSLKSPYALTFGSKTYDGSAAKTITASDLGALTAHQTIYNLTMQAGAFSAVTFDPNGAAKTVNIPTTTSHISEGTNLYFTNARAVSALSSTLSGYLPLSGGTITGVLGIKASESPSIIQYYAGGTYYGALGFSAANSPIFRNTSGINNILLHTGNYSSYAYPAVGKGFMSFDGKGRPVMDNNQGYAAKNNSGAIEEIIWLGNDNVVHVGGTISKKTNIYGTLTINGKDAIHSGNIGSQSVDSATKLATARTIWGQSFDGTRNVSGNLSNVGNITTNSSNTDIYLQQSTDSRSWWTGIGVSSGDDKYVIYDATAKQHRLSIDTSGNVGIGTTSPSYKLDVNGAVRVGNNVANGVLLKFNMDRAWHFYQEGSGSTSALVLQSGTSGKYFHIKNDSGSNIASFFASSESGNRVGVNGVFEATTIYQNGTSLDSLLNTKLNSSSYTAADVLAKLKTVDGSGSGLDADTLDGVHLMGKGGQRGIMRSWARGTYTTSKQYFGNGNVVVIDPKPTDDSNLWANTTIFSLGDLEIRSHQLAFGYTEDKLLYRRVDDGPTYNSWKIIAFTTSNVASATKLQTARTIWGQSFDGTGNVSGVIYMPNNTALCQKDANGNDLRAIFTSTAGSLAIGNDHAEKGYITYLSGNQVILRYGKTRVAGLYLSHLGNVGIGTVTPIEKLHVEGKILSNSIRIFGKEVTDDSKGLFIQASDKTNRALITWNGNLANSDYLNIATRYGNIVLAPARNVGIGTNSPSYKLHVAGTAYISSNLLTGGGITMYSARVLKNVVDEDGLSLRELSVIKPTRYTWKDKRDERLHIGGIADDIQQVLPEVVYRTPDGVLTMDYGNAAFAIASSLIKPMIEHESEIVSLKRKVRELEEEVKRLRA